MNNSFIVSTSYFSLSFSYCVFDVGTTNRVYYSCVSGTVEELEMYNCTFKDISSSSSVLNFTGVDGKNLSFLSSLFENISSSRPTNGAAICLRYSNTIDSTYKTVFFYNCSFKSCTVQQGGGVSGGYGGAIFVMGVRILLISCIFNNNSGYFNINNRYDDVYVNSSSGFLFCYLY
jgi:hypothetical protein